MKYKGTMMATRGWPYTDSEGNNDVMAQARSCSMWKAPHFGHYQNSSEVQVQAKLSYPIPGSSREHSPKIRVERIRNWFSKLGMVGEIKEIC